MDIVFLVCVVTVTVISVIWTVYFVLAMQQVQKAAKEIEITAKMVNTASPYIDIIFLAGRLISKFAGKLKIFK
jgi:hypothetical protein